MLPSSFRAHPLLRGAHLQTMASLLRPVPKLVLRCERLELPDGDFVDVGWSGEHNKSGPLAVLVHVLCCGSESKYTRGTASQLIARGWRTVILQLRGAAGGLPQCGGLLHTLLLWPLVAEHSSPDSRRACAG